jgi:hypothetical protein
MPAETTTRAPQSRWNYFTAAELVVLTTLLNWMPDLPFSDDERRTADRLRGSLSDEVMARTVGQTGDPT